MIIEVEFDTFRQYIECENDICENIVELREEFLEWLYDETIDHQYWNYLDGIKAGVGFSADALVEWFNTVKYSERTTKVVLLDAKFMEPNLVNASIFF
ncbi:hypothetical protein [Paenibacillus agilis]|uniref:Uncharacterized protein n=1 Tax=Paenibacillus agilis TaxID=3020863 RepID=A0A559J2I3_9BACL|nr:hypothetical protein [Paenibacillus agilis]TVX94062.1 hypothetical protein FPZ44_13955 [Paenibacillus agilis]